MTNPDKTLIAALLDRSYSMNTSKHATEQGFNDLIKDQARQDGEALVTLAQFDDGGNAWRQHPNWLNNTGNWWGGDRPILADAGANQVPEFVYKMRDITSVPKLNLVPRGNTPLLDAIGNFVTEIGSDLSKMREQDRPGTVIVAILTDGQENCSRRWSRSQIRDLIREQEDVWKWKFLFLGSNIDAVHEAATFGIARDAAITYDDDAPVAVAAAMAATSNVMSNYRMGNFAAASYTDADRSAAVGK